MHPLDAQVLANGTELRRDVRPSRAPRKVEVGSSRLTESIGPGAPYTPLHTSVMSVNLPGGSEIGLARGRVRIDSSPCPAVSRISSKQGWSSIMACFRYESSVV